MNFAPELAEAVVEGRKTVTRRLVSNNPRSPYHPNRIGQMIDKTIAVCPGRGKAALGRAVVRSVSRERRFYPQLVDHREAAREGFREKLMGDPMKFAEAWWAMHGRGACDVWRIELAEARSQ